MAKKLPSISDFEKEELFDDLDCEDESSEIITGEFLENNNLKEMPIDIFEQSKKALAEKKKQISLSLDNKKLDEAVKLIEGMQGISNIMTDAEVIAKIKKNTNTPMDMKFLSDAYGKFADKLATLQRIDTIDENGSGKRLFLQIEDANGNSIKAMIDK